MHSQPLPGKASRRRAEDQFKTAIPKLRPTPHGKPRPRKRRACGHFGWPRKQPTRIPQIATRRQRRPVDLSRGSAFQDLWLQVRQNPGKGPRTGAGRGPSTPLPRSAGDFALGSYNSPNRHRRRPTGCRPNPRDVDAGARCPGRAALSG